MLYICVHIYEVIFHWLAPFSGSCDESLIGFQAPIKDPWIRWPGPARLHVIERRGWGGGVTKLLLMRFHKAPHQAVPSCILANSLINNSSPKTRRFVLNLHIQQEARWKISLLGGGGGLINSNVLSVPNSQMQIEEKKWSRVELMKPHYANAQLMLMLAALWRGG